jgi:hypothetical protein
MTLKSIIIPILIIAIFSGSNSINNNGKLHYSPTIFSNQEPDSVTTIKFDELSVSISRLAIDDENNKTSQIQKETIEISAQPGETIEEQLISVSSTLLTDLTIEQRYQTSIMVSYEGKHCDLTNWKHFYSDWQLLSSNKTGIFVGNKYTEKDYKKLPKVSLEELKKKVKEKCGRNWLTIINKVKSLNEYPIDVGISRYYLRITGKRKNNGQKVTKLIIINIPMGC